MRCSTGIKTQWGTMDFLVHAVAFSDKNELKGRYADSTRENFIRTMVISCYAFTEAAKRAAALMPNGGTMVTLTYNGGERAMPNYNVMGVAKAGLEASVRYLAVDFGHQKIRVNAISAGPIRTLAGAGITDARYMFAFQQKYSPLGRGVTLEELGGAGLYLLSDLSTGVTGEVHFVDSGYNVIAMPQPDALKNAGGAGGRRTSSHRCEQKTAGKIPGRFALRCLKPGSGGLLAGNVEAVGVHHLGPRRHEVLRELLLRVRAAIDFREGAQLRVRAEDQVDAGAGPLDRFGLAVAALVHAVGAGRLPFRAHVEQVDEEVVGQRPRLLGEDAVLGAAGIGAEHAQAADEHRHLRSGQRQQLRPIHQRLLRRHELRLAADVVAEAVGDRLERREGVRRRSAPATHPCGPA